MYSLNVQKRTENENVNSLRTQGIVPAVVYGHGVGTESVKLPLVAFEKMYAKAGTSSLVTMQIESETEARMVIVQDVQIDPVRSTPIHVDFYQIRKDEEMHANVKLVFQGESFAVKNLGCVLVKQLNEITITCLPKDLVSEINVDISVLANAGDLIRVKDITLPAGIQTKVDPQAVIAGVTLQQEEVDKPIVSEADAIASQQKAGEQKTKEGGEEVEEKKTEKE